MSDEEIGLALQVARLVLDIDPKTGEGRQEQIEQLAGMLDCSVTKLLDLGLTLEARLS